MKVLSRARVVAQLRRINSKWRERLLHEADHKSPMTLTDMLDVMEAAGLILPEKSLEHYDGQCHGITVQGVRCKIDGLVPEDLFCATHQDQSPE